jgi:malonyl-CoA/methylmalonyl-CoA synthetase
MASKNEGTWDRTSYVPRHTGQNVIPNTPMLSQVLRHAMVHNRLAVKEKVMGREKNYAELIADVVHLRNIVHEQLSPEIRTSLDAGQEVFIGVLAAGGYDYVVAFLAVLALKAAIVPMSELLLREEDLDLLIMS